ncbi:MAG: hypothetical protein ACN4GM_08285 [Gammaproteobacteria bacterium]
MKQAFMIIISSYFFLFSASVSSVPPVTGDPVIQQFLGNLMWPQDTIVQDPYLTQLNSNDINDLHGDMDCDFIISTAGNYHFALLEAMHGGSYPGLGNFAGLQAELLKPENGGVKVCWSTSPPVSVNQIANEQLQVKNIIMHGKPALAMGPKNLMVSLYNAGFIDGPDAENAGTPFLSNKGNSILIRADKANKISDICDLGAKNIRVVTPNNVLEPGSFGNFSGTIFNVADQNNFGCDATTLFDSIFSQDISTIDTSAFANPTDVPAVLRVFTSGNKMKWVASSRTMHRDIPYALCFNLADAAVIFHHQATYLKDTLATSMNCQLEIIPLPGTQAQPMGNKFATLKIAKVLGHTDTNVLNAQDYVYEFFVGSPIWTQILMKHDLVDPSPN